LPARVGRVPIDGVLLLDVRLVEVRLDADLRAKLLDLGVGAQRLAIRLSAATARSL